MSAQDAERLKQALAQTLEWDADSVEGAVAAITSAKSRQVTVRMMERVQNAFERCVDTR